MGITGAEYNAESDLDLQYAMTLVGKSQSVTLYQVGDIFEGKVVPRVMCTYSSSRS